MKKLLSTKLNLLFIFIYFIYVSYITIKISKGLDFGDSFTYFAHQDLTLDYLTSRYYNWTSRLLIEAVLLPLSRYETAFIVINFFIMLLMPLIIALALDMEKYFWLIIILIISYPFYPDMSSAGWIATIVNYYFPLFFAFIAINLLREEKGFSFQQFILLNVCLIFSCNAEMICLPLAFVFSFFFITKENLRPRLWFPLLICFASLVMATLAPGNTNRVIGETFTWNPDFINQSLLYKAYIGFQTTVSRYFLSFSPIFFIFSILTTVQVCLKVFDCKGISTNNSLFIQCKGGKLSHEKFFPLMLLSLFVIGLFTLLLIDFQSIYVSRVMTTHYSQAITEYLVFYFSIVLFLITLYLVYFCFNDKKKGFITSSLLFIGFLVRFSIGLSPTVFASSTRTHLVTDFTIIVVSLFIIDEIYNSITHGY